MSSDSEFIFMGPSIVNNPGGPVISDIKLWQSPDKVNVFASWTTEPAAYGAFFFKIEDEYDEKAKTRPPRQGSYTRLPSRYIWTLKGALPLPKHFNKIAMVRWLA